MNNGGTTVAARPTRKAGVKPPEVLKAAMPAAVKQFATQTVDRAEAAFDKANAITEQGMQVFDRTAVAFRVGTAELQAKVMEIAQMNVEAAFAFVRKLIEAKSAEQLIALHQAYVREQAAAFARQAQDLNALALKLIQETAQPVHEGMLKSLSDLRTTWVA